MHPSHTAIMLGLGGSMLVALLGWIALRAYLSNKEVRTLVEMLVACDQVELPPLNHSCVDTLAQHSTNALHRAKRKLEQMALQGACSHQKCFLAYRHIEHAWEQAIRDAIWEQAPEQSARVAIFYDRMWASEADGCFGRILADYNETLRAALEATMMDENSREDRFDNRVPFTKIEQAVRIAQERGGQLSVVNRSQGQFGWLVLRAG